MDVGKTWDEEVWEGGGKREIAKEWNDDQPLPKNTSSSFAISKILANNSVGSEKTCPLLLIGPLVPHPPMLPDILREMGGVGSREYEVEGDDEGPFQPWRPRVSVRSGPTSPTTATALTELQSRPFPVAARSALPIPLNPDPLIDTTIAALGFTKQIHSSTLLFLSSSLWLAVDGERACVMFVRG
jgi:hypothetical protein